jgi:hypothetical protein
MDELKTLESMGLVLPGPAYILGAIVFGIIGIIAFSRGRNTRRPELLWSGLAMMLYPYAVSQTWLLWVLGFGLCAWVYLKWD